MVGKVSERIVTYYEGVGLVQYDFIQATMIPLPNIPNLKLGLLLIYFSLTVYGSFHLVICQFVNVYHEHDVYQYVLVQV